MFDTIRLQDALSQYKKDFLAFQWKNEKYKWEAIKCFQEYWNINAELSPLDTDFPFKARYHGEKKNGRIEKVKIGSKEETDALLARIANGQYSVDSVKKGRKHRQPFAPFTTSTLQQEASRRISFTSRKTMSVAQQL